MKVIGLTGIIGSGKSTVASMLERLGVALIDADAVVADIREADLEARRAIQERFGTLDRSELAATVFGDPAALADLEAILHPRVRDAVDARLAELRRTGTEAASVEAIKLVGSPLEARCDQIWVVRCQLGDAIERLARSRGMSEREVRARLAAQMPQDELLARADVVIDNRGSLEATRQQVSAALAALLSGTPGS
jgi:dephospho-CoA kinase